MSPSNARWDNTRATRPLEVLDFGKQVRIEHGPQTIYYNERYSIIAYGVEVPTTKAEKRLVQELFKQKLIELAETSLTNRLLEMPE